MRVYLLIYYQNLGYQLFIDTIRSKFKKKLYTKSSFKKNIYLETPCMCSIYREEGSRIFRRGTVRLGTVRLKKKKLTEPNLTKPNRN